MTRSLKLAAIPLLLVAASGSGLAQTVAAKQTVKKPPAKTAAKPAPKTAPKTPDPDLAISMSYAVADKTTTGTILMQGQRQRVSSDGPLATVQMCDQHRSVQLNSTTRVYLETPDPTPASIPMTPVGEKHKGGHITYTTTVVDTGETKTIFGFTAHRLKTTITKESSPDACDKRPEKVEIDGWYIDAPNSVACLGAPPPEQETRVDPKDATCSDSVTYVRPPASKAQPVSYTMVIAAGTDAPVTTTMEASEVKRAKLDPQQFEIPADYIPVQTVTQLTMDHRPGEVGVKKPGTIRLGVAPVGNTSGQPIATDDLSQALVESFEEAQSDVVGLKGTTPAQQDDEAKTLACDYILTNTVREIKHPGHSMLGKIGGTNGDALAAKVEYSLARPGVPKPVLTASEHSGTSMVQTAVGAAKHISQFVLPMMMGYGYLKAFSAMSGTATPALMRQTQDPMLSAVFSLVDRATGTKPQPVLTTENGVAAAALQKEIDAVIAELKKLGS